MICLNKSGIVKLIALKSTLFKNAIANSVSDIVNIVIANSGSELTEDSETSWNLCVEILWLN